MRWMAGSPSPVSPVANRIWELAFHLRCFLSPQRTPATAPVTEQCKQQEACDGTEARGKTQLLPDRPAGGRASVYRSAQSHASQGGRFWDILCITDKPSTGFRPMLGMNGALWGSLTSHIYCFSGSQLCLFPVWYTPVTQEPVVL